MSASLMDGANTIRATELLEVHMAIPIPISRVRSETEYESTL